MQHHTLVKDPLASAARDAGGPCSFASVQNRSLAKGSLARGEMQLMPQTRMPYSCPSMNEEASEAVGS